MASHVHSTPTRHHPINSVSISVPLAFPPAVIARVLEQIPVRRRGIVRDRIELLAAEGYRLVWIDVLESSVDLELVPVGSEYNAETALLFTIAWPLLEDVAGTA